MQQCSAYIWWNNVGYTIHKCESSMYLLNESHEIWNKEQGNKSSLRCLHEIEKSETTSWKV